MPMPKLKEIQYSPIAVRKAGQVKKNAAATAPVWRMMKTITVNQLIPSRLTSGVAVLSMLE